MNIDLERYSLLCIFYQYVYYTNIIGTQNCSHQNFKDHSLIEYVLLIL